MSDSALKTANNVRKRMNGHDQHTAEKKSNANQSLLSRLNSIEGELKEASKKTIVFSDPLLSFYDTPLIREGTINVIQGKFGSHKSRLSEMICALLLHKLPGPSYFLGLKKNVRRENTVALIDTERNLKEELPYAIQGIKRQAGYDITDEIENFRFTSIKHLERKERLKAIKIYIEDLRKNIPQRHHLFVALDVVTDCVGSFNDDRESMALFDFLGNLCDNSSCTFLLVIHENPFGEKARGHIGTEAANKASTVMQIGFMPGQSNEPSDLIRLKFVKLRGAKRPDPVYLEYCPQRKGLKPASNELINSVENDRQQVAPIEEVEDFVYDLIFDSEGLTMDRSELIKSIMEKYGCSKNTAGDRLKKIEENAIGYHDGNTDYELKVNGGRGKAKIYSLVKIKEEEPNEIPF